MFDENIFIKAERLDFYVTISYDSHFALSDSSCQYFSSNIITFKEPIDGYVFAKCKEFANVVDFVENTT